VKPSPVRRLHVLSVVEIDTFYLPDVLLDGSISKVTSQGLDSRGLAPVPVFFFSSLTCSKQFWSCIQLLLILLCSSFVGKGGCSVRLTTELVPWNLPAHRLLLHGVVVRFRGNSILVKL